MAEFERNLGREHPTTLSVLALREKVLGEEDPATPSSAFNLAATLLEIGRDDEALKLARRCLSGRTKTLGENHPHTKAARRFVEALEAIG